MNIYLIGMPGSGKTTLGKQLALHLHYSFVDMDEEIEHAERRSIAEIFEQEGEEEFRELEKDMLHQISTGKNLIISTGGGAPCFFDNMNFINRSGLSIFLDVTPSELYRRMNQHNTQKRPMLKNKTQEELLEEITSKYHNRLSYYSQAQIIISNNNIQLADILKTLSKEY